MNKILDREKQEHEILHLLTLFYANKDCPTAKKGIYVCGETGSGKSQFVMNLLKNNNYDAIKYDASDIRNKSIIDNITRNNIADKNIISMFQKKAKNIVIVMDEIDGMNNGDKGGINTLIKLIRPKKTKKQKLEENSFHPIICIGNYYVDKKIKELIKVCHVIELKTPTRMQMSRLIEDMFPVLDPVIQGSLNQHVQFDLRKLHTLYTIYQQNPSLITPVYLNTIFQMKTYIDDTKDITRKLFNNHVPLDRHNQIVNDTDRTIIGLLWHENVIDVLEPFPKETTIPFYLELLQNMCFADHIDRITFQKQIWQFNEMSSLIKTFKTNALVHEFFPKKKEVTDIRFTKVLTKYSTEYNNTMFIQHLCQQLSMCKDDLISYFIYLKDQPDLEILFENYDIGKLDILRLYRYIDKYTSVNAIGLAHDPEIVEIYSETIVEY